MNDERRLEVEVEVPATPEEAWEAIATGPGITAWFMPAEVEGRVGGVVVHHHDADASSRGRVIGYDRPKRFAYEESSEEFTPPGGPPVTATEFLVEATSGGTCVMRIVMSGFGDGDAWDQTIESFRSGWTRALASLRLYLTHFKGELAYSINAFTTLEGRDGAWERVAAALEMPEVPQLGDEIATGGTAPQLAGRVEDQGDGMLTLLLDRPTSGIGFLGASEFGDGGFAVFRAQLFGPGAESIAAQEQEAWKAWLADHLP